MHHRYYLSIFIVVVGFCPISVKAQISTPPGWSFVRNLESEVTHVYAYGDTVLALEGNIFLRTVDGGENWDSVVIPSSNWILEVSPIVPVLVIFRSAVRDSIHSDYFISTSHDLGNSFQTFKLDTSISNLMYCCDISLVLSPYNEKMLYLTYTSDAGTLLFSSSNEGQDWKKIYYPKEAPEILINQIFDARIISRWYLDIIEKSGEMRVLRGVYRTDDNGESFVKDSLWYIDYASIGYSGEFRISIDEGFRVFNSDTAINSYWDDDWYFRVMKTNDAYAEDGDRLSRMIAFDFAWNSPNTSIATFQDDSVKDVANRQHYRRVLAQTFDNGKNFNILWDDSISSLDAYLDQTNHKNIWVVTHDSDRYGIDTRSRLLRFPAVQSGVAMAQSIPTTSLQAWVDLEGKMNLNYTTNQGGPVRVWIFDVLGRPIKEAFFEPQDVSEHHVKIELPADLPNGDYFVEALGAVRGSATFHILH